MTAPAPAMLVVMGVSGSGKSTIARRLADTLGWDFLDGDDLHPPANVARMRAGVPLEDGLSLTIGAVLLGWIGAWLAVARHLRELAPR